MMDELLQTLRSEVLDLRAQSESLTRQMWLMYATFEDVVCINFPHRQAALLASSVDIDSYLSAPLDSEEIVKKREENERTAISRDQRALNVPAGGRISQLSRPTCQRDCTSGAPVQQQTSRRFCLEKQQIESGEVVSLDVRVVSVCYQPDFESNDSSPGRRGYRASGKHVVETAHVHKTKDRRELDWGKRSDRIDQSSDLLQAETDRNGLHTNDTLGNRLMVRGDNRTILNFGLMRSTSEMTTGQFVGESSLVSREKRPSLSGHASLPQHSREGLYSGTKVVSRHSYPSGRSEMGVRSATFQNSAWYPESDYCLAKAIPGRGVTQISSPFNTHSSAPDHGRRPAERGPAERRSLDSLQARQNNKSAFSVCTKAEWTRMYKIRDSMRRNECGSDRVGQSREMSSARKRADDTQLSPVTISSGYDSDSIPSPVQPELYKCGGSVNTDDDHTDYFSQSDTYPKSEGVDSDKSRDSLGLLPYEVRSKQTPFIPVLGKSRFVRFGQHHNAPLSPGQSGQSPTSCHKQSRKLAKVTRSMYAIIHDLQDENARRKMRRHSCDAVQEKHGCGWRDVRGGVSLSPIVSPELRSRADVLTPQSEPGDLQSSPETLADDTPTHIPHVDRGFVSPTTTYSQVRKKQCAMSAVTQRLFHMDIQHQSKVEDDLRNPADLADDSCVRELVRRESAKQGQKYTKGSEPVSDNEHIYEIIPGDESLLNAVGMGTSGNPKLSKWSTVVDLDLPSEVPPALPERSYQGKEKMEPPIPPRCRLNAVKNSANQCDESVKLVCDNDDQDYAVVRKIKPADKVSLGGCLGRLDEVDSDLDSELYSRVCPPQPRQRNTFDFSDLTSETYCRLDTVRKASGVEEWSPGDMLNFIDGIHEQHTPKTRDNIYRLLQNSKTRAKFCESLEIETRLLHKGLLCNSWESDDVTMSMTSEKLNCDFRQEIQPTYV